MAKKKLLHLFYFDNGVAGRDMFLVPMYLAEQLGVEMEIVFPKRENNKHYTGYYRGVKLTPIKSDSNHIDTTFWSERSMTWWLIKNARKADVLFLYWLNKRNIWYCFLYKLLNPKGICYLKVDGEIWYGSYKSFVRRVRRKIVELFFYQRFDVVSVETEAVFKAVKKGLYGDVWKDRILIVSNGFDYKLFDELGIRRKSFAEKENLIITVGQIGTYYKNSEFMLDVLDGMDLNEWEFHFIGPVEPSFVSKYDDFCKRNPNSASKVKLIGCINDRRNLWEQYNRAKIFALTSRKEGMPNVYIEANAFGNYILTTDVSSAEDITDHQRLGAIIPQGDIEGYRNKLRYLMDNQNVLEEAFPEIIELSEKKYNCNIQVKNVADRIKEIWDNR